MRHPRNPVEALIWGATGGMIAGLAVAAIVLILGLSVGAARAADTTPFARMGDPNFLPATTIAQQFQITQPKNATSYRFVNPCSVDIRIRSVASMTDPVTTTTGTRFLARTAETLASTPALTQPRTVSIIALGDPGPGGCVTELQYGSGQ